MLALSIIKDPSRTHNQAIILKCLHSWIDGDGRWSKPLMLLPECQRVLGLRALVDLFLAHCYETLDVRDGSPTRMRCIVILFLT